MLPKELFSRFGSGLSQTRGLGFSTLTSSFASCQIASKQHALEGRIRQLSILSASCYRNSSHFEKFLHRRTSKTAILPQLVLTHPVARRRWPTCANIMEPPEGSEQRWTAPVVRQTFLDFFTERGVSISIFTTPVVILC